MLITSFRLLWIDYSRAFAYDDQPLAKKGILDLRGFEFSHRKSLVLNGQWEFYPSEFIWEFDKILDKTTYLQVPGDWDEAFDESSDRGFKYGTYRLRILLGDNHPKSLSMRIEKISNASKFYINGKLMGEAGIPSQFFDSHKAFKVPYRIDIEPDHNVLDIVIHNSNHLSKGGITRSIRLGESSAIDRFIHTSIGSQFLLIIVLLINSFYSLSLYLLGIKNKGLIYSSLLLFFGIMGILMLEDKLLLSVFKIDYNLFNKIALLNYTFIGMLIPLIAYFFLNLKNKMEFSHIQILLTTSFAYILFVIFAPYNILAPTSFILVAIIIFSILLATSMVFRAVIKKRNLMFLLLACLFLGSDLTWMIIKYSFSLELLHYPFDMMFATFAFVAFWFNDFVLSRNNAISLAKKLELEDKKKDAFLVNTSHELREPLYDIRNIIQTILEDSEHPINENHRIMLESLIDINKNMGYKLHDIVDERLRIEAAWLQSQIQPHFVFNTLNTIASLAVIDVDKMGQLLEKFSEYLRLSIDFKNAKPLIDINQELSLIKSYLYIQKKRFGERINIIWDLQANLHISIPPLTIQPLVENAINHGILKRNQGGTITISIKKTDNFFIIMVGDDGVGIEGNELNSILKDLRDDGPNRMGIGLRNINKRLNQIYNKDLSIESKPNKGTKVSFKVMP